MTLELEQGEIFVQDEFSLTDSSGFVYAASDGVLDYVHVGDKEFRFVVPYGIASGLATLSVGAKGRDPYVFDVEIVRLFGTLSASGVLSFRDLDAPDREYGSYQAGSGAGSMSLSAAGDQLIAVSQASGEVHFLEVRADELVPFAPSLNLTFALRRGVLVDGGALVAADHGVAFIARRGNDLVLEEWLDTGPAVSVAAAADLGRAITVGTTNDASPVDFMQRLNLASLPPEVTPPTILIGGSAGGVADVAIDPDGEIGVAVNTLDDTLVKVSLTATPVVPEIRPLPDGNTGPTRVVMSRRGNYLAVICSTSKTVSVYAVADGGIAPVTWLPADPRVTDPALAKDPVDVGFAPPDRMLILLADGAVTHVDLSADPPAISLLRDAQSNAAAALVVQP